MKKLALLVLLISGVAVAGAPASSIQVPPGWNDVSSLPAITEQFGKLRSVPNTVGVEYTAWISPDGMSQLTVIEWLQRVDSKPSRRIIEALDFGISQGGKQKVLERISDSRHWNGAQLFSEQLDKVNGSMWMRTQRYFAVDSKDIVHILIGMCAAPTRETSCDNALASFKLVVPDQKAVAENPELDDLPYTIGKIAGVIVVVLLAMYIMKRVRKEP